MSPVKLSERPSNMAGAPSCYLHGCCALYFNLIRIEMDYLRHNGHPCAARGGPTGGGAQDLAAAAGGGVCSTSTL